MADRFQKSPTGTRARLNLTIDPQVLEDARELLHNSGRSISEVVTELLAEEVQRLKGESKPKKGKAS